MRLALTIGIGVALAGGLAGCSDEVTFYKHVEPILQERCQGCHVEGGVGPFPLKTYAQVKAKASYIASAVESRKMPPWPPSKNGLPLLHDRSLTDEQIETLKAWHKANAPEGSRDDHKDRAPLGPSIKPDLEVAMPVAYTPDAKLADDYRCFTIDPALTETQNLVGYNIKPGSPSMVHHVILFEVLNQGTALAELQGLEDADATPGYQCFGGAMISASSGGGSFPPLRFLGGWAPGVGAVVLPKGTGLPVYAGAKLVMQVHYNTHHGVLPDLTSAELEFARGDVIGAIVIPVAETSFLIQPGEKNAVVTDQLSIPPQFPVQKIYGTFPHMHLRGQSISMTLTQNGTEKTLIDIPKWDFKWQGGYDLVDPISTLPGDTVHLTCRYDNSAENQPVVDGARLPPQPLTWGEGTNDEMCLGFVYVTL